MSKFTNSLEELFSAEAEALTSNSADYLIQKFQTNEQETEHQAADAGTKPGSRKRNTAAIDQTIPGIPKGHSEGSKESAGSEGSDAD